MEIKLPKQSRQAAIESIRSFFLTERDEEIGDLFAGFLLDHFLRNVGPAVYNQAIKDACALMNDKIEDLYGLEKRVPSPGCATKP